MERAEIVAGLRIIPRLLSKLDINNSTRQSFDTWVAQFFPQQPTKPTEPRPCLYKEYPPAVSPKYPSKVTAIILFLVAGLCSFPMLVCVLDWIFDLPEDIVVSPDPTGEFLWYLVLCSIIAGLGLAFFVRYKRVKKNPSPGPYRDYLEECEKVRKSNEDAAQWNRNELPKIWANYQTQLNQYKSDCAEWEQSCTRIRKEKRPEYDAWISGLDDELARINSALSLCSNLLHNSYWQNANELADLIEKGRADSVKEAVNLFVQEENERQRHNAIMQAQKEAAEDRALQTEAWRLVEYATAERRHEEMVEAQHAAGSAALCANCAIANSCAYFGHGAAYCFRARE